MIQTPRLILKLISPEYTEEIFREFTPEITTFMFPKAPDDISETEDFVNGSIQKNTKDESLQIVILESNTKEFLGCGGLNNINTKTPELGIWLKKSAHGNGYGKESIIGLKSWADEHLTYEYLLYPVDKDNIPSKKIPEALGGVIAKEYTQTGAGGNLLNIVEYHIYSSK